MIRCGRVAQIDPTQDRSLGIARPEFQGGLPIASRWDGGLRGSLVDDAKEAIGKCCFDFVGQVLEKHFENLGLALDVGVWRCET